MDISNQKQQSQTGSKKQTKKKQIWAELWVHFWELQHRASTQIFNRWMQHVNGLSEFLDQGVKKCIGVVLHIWYREM